MKTALITKHLSKDSLLREQLLKEGVELIERPFIFTSPISSVSEWPHAKWVFFSSPKGAEISIKLGLDLSKYRIAALGEGTAKSLPKTVKPEFVGHSTDTRAVAEDFLKFVGDESVLFPLSDRSLKNVSSIFPENQKTEVQCYHTTTVAMDCPKTDVIIFSSPSNVEGFLLKNKISPHQKVITFGPSTALYCVEHQIEVSESLENTQDSTLLTTILKWISRS